MTGLLYKKNISFAGRRGWYSLLQASAVALLLLVSAVDAAVAQPAARRRQQQRQNASNAQTLTTRAQISYPVAAKMSEDVVWRRDIYREIFLEEDANAPLYYPVEPIGSQMNLFTYLFKLIMRTIPAYEYRLDGNEVFTDSAKINRKAFLGNYHIYYERTNRGVTIDDSDIPSSEVKSYYIKESAYFDQASATFHIKPVALCPVLWRTDDFGDGEQKYPLFWVKYDDIAPYLGKQVIMTSNLNNAATMSMDDYFTRNLYEGKIYKTSNMLGRTLAQYCPTDSALAKEQRRIEGELAAFEKNIWGDQARKDSLDSIAKAEVKDKKGRKAKRNRRASSTTVSKKRSRSKSSGGGSSAARVTVRRQRH